MPLSDEDVAALRADLERVQREKETTRADLERVQREKEAGNREYEAKLDRLRRERSVGTSFDGLGGGSSDRLGTAASTMGPMWTWGEYRWWLGAEFAVCSSGYCTEIPHGMPSLCIHRLGETF